LRLKRQIIEASIAPGEENRIRVDELNEVDRRMLKEALRQALMLQDRLRIDYR
jgi:CBS domain-containing protein